MARDLSEIAFSIGTSVASGSIRELRPTSPSSGSILITKRWCVVLALVAGCSDSGVGPDASESISIHLDAERVREATLVVGDSLRLTIQRANRDAPPGSVEVVWHADDPSVARLASHSSSSVIVHGDSFGSSRVIATSAGRADTIVVSVFSPYSDGRCDGDGLNLALGQSYTSTAAAAGPICLAQAPSTGADYIVVPFNSAFGGQRLLVEVAGQGIAPWTAGSVSAASDTARVSIGSIPPPGVDADFAGRFDRQLRDREFRELSPLVEQLSPRAKAVHEVAAAVVLPAVGDTLRLNVNSQQTCSAAVERRARVTAVGTRAIFLEDTSNPTGGFSAADYQAFASAFDNVVHPTITNNFGTPTDIDGNGRVFVLFTRAVNELTPRDSDGYVAGFFFARDLFPVRGADGLSGCATSNEGEILYMLAPDPTGVVNGNVRLRSTVAERTNGVIGHELQHLVSASRRLRVLGVSSWSEEFWLNEGLSHIAEELLFYASSGSFAPRTEININRLRNAFVGTSRFNQYQAANFGRFATYLAAPGDASPIVGSDLATRGAGWAFLRYAADRRGGTEAELWRSLIDTGRTGYANLLSALGSSPMAWMHDWAVALYVDDIVSSVPSRFRQPSWNFRSIMPSMSTISSYPLKVTDLVPGAGAAPARLDLVAGGTGVVRFRVAPDGLPQIRITSGGASPPPELRFTILRVR